MLLALLAGLGVAACSGPQSTLDPAGPSARLAANLWWGMLAFSTLVFVALIALWLYAMFRTPRQYDDDTRRRLSRRWIIGGGIALPMLSITVLLAFGIPSGHRMLPLPVGEEQVLKIEVTGHQWWWEVHYPDHDVTTANEIAIPAGRPVDIHVRSADVIHAFWVPRLAGKIDMLPEQTNVLRLEADQPGTYNGQCAEFCGTQHARMAFTLDALEADAFDDWLAARSPEVLARNIDTRTHEEASELFAAECAQCHAITGLSDAREGPDLSGIGARRTLGAGQLPNDEGAIARWLREHQQLKPGNHMPVQDHLSDTEIEALAQWLETLEP